MNDLLLKICRSEQGVRAAGLWIFWASLPLMGYFSGILGSAEDVVAKREKEEKERSNR